MLIIIEIFEGVSRDFVVITVYSSKLEIYIFNENGIGSKYLLVNGLFIRQK